LGYKNGYVTVDNADWYVEVLLSQAANAGKKIDFPKLCSTYSRIMAEEAHFFDQMSVHALGRSVKHIFLLHETDVNALCIGDLVKRLRNQNWKIITADEAYTDEISSKEPSASVNLGQGRVFALAKEAGYQGPYFSKWNEEENIEAEFIKEKVW
jgi:peptidoglycan-N-acetylglucosamine deacetylase